MVRYQVFLSFRGPETRDNLVQYLYDQLKRNGVEAFLDSEKIDFGQVIGPEIVDAIERSDICVPVFSQDFASSPACLKEVAQMVKLGKKIRPIFFFVEPCIVRHRLGTYGKSFAEHKRQNRYRESTIKEWEDALEKIGGILGPEFKQADLKPALRPALKAALRPALREIGHGPEFKEAALEVALESAVEAALEAAQASLQAALQEQTDVIQEPESKKAALEAALGENGVMKRPGFKEAALEEMGGTNGRFYNDLFSGFKKLEGFVTGLVDLLHMDEKEKTKNLVGLDRAVPQMVRKLGFNYQDGQVVRKQEITGRMVFVVRGIAGVGKTTLAREVYNNIRHLFNGCSFLENIRYKTTEKDVVSLQNNLIRDLTGGRCQEVKYSEDGTKKIKHLQGDRVLIVLDNVENSEQIKPLANEVTWFGPGSIIILTSRRADIITHFKVPENSKPEELCKLDHQVSSMNKDDALELFYKHAIIKPDDLPTNLSEEITSAVGRLPLAIEIVGKYLCGKSIKIWKEAPDRLKGDLEKQLEILYKENYDSLCENTKEIFLDIACFFRGVKKRNPYYMWDALQRCPHTVFEKLQDLSFVKIGEENEFQMHNQLVIFGRKTVKKNCKDPGERSRLWDYEDVRTALREKQCIKKVDALRVTPKGDQDSKFNYFHWKDFLHLPRLRFLDLDDFDIKGNSEDGSVDIRGNTEGVLWDLVWLNWHECREKSQLFALSMEKLVILDLCSSQVKLSLEDWRTLMRKATRLKVLNAKDCRSIEAALEFPKTVFLEHLILEGCLLVIPTAHLSTSGLVHLVTLNMKGCTKITSLPEALFPLKALKELLIDEFNIKTLDFQKGFLPSLEILSACKCKNLVDVKTITILENLQKLSLRSCEKLKQLPDLIGSLTKLQEMDLSHTLVRELPPSVSKLDNLQVLKMVRTPLIRFPEAIKNLNKLEELDFSHCGSMKGECIITGLDFLRILRLRGTRILRVLARDNGNFRLRTLELDNGDNGQMAS